VTYVCWGLFTKESQNDADISTDGAFIAFGVLGTSEMRAEGPLYGAQFYSRDLLTINTTTGAGTAVGQMGFNGVAGLAFDPNTNTYYGSDTRNDQLLTINATTGQATAVGLFEIDNILALAFDPNTNTLYGAALGINSLVTINTATGQATVVGTMVGSGGFVAGLAFDPNTNTLYGSESSTGQLLTINTTTGVATALGPLGFTGVWALTYEFDIEPLDTDGDGVSDDEDAFPNDPNEQSDNDADGIGDNADTDDDDDGLSDDEESVLGTDPSMADTDGDEIDDGQDFFPLDSERSSFEDFALFIRDEACTLGDGDWKNANMQRPFKNKLTVVVNLIHEADVAETEEDQFAFLLEAYLKLENDLIAKTDGFAGGQTKNDWVITPEGQAILHSDLVILSEALADVLLLP
jgi:hypothetical protein